MWRLGEQLKNNDAVWMKVSSTIQETTWGFATQENFVRLLSGSG